MPLSPAAICRCTETMADWGMAKLTGILGRLRAQDVKVRHPLLRGSLLRVLMLGLVLLNIVLGLLVLGGVT